MIFLQSLQVGVTTKRLKAFDLVVCQGRRDHHEGDSSDCRENNIHVVVSKQIVFVIFVQSLQCPLSFRQTGVGGCYMQVHCTKFEWPCGLRSWGGELCGS